MKKNIDIPINLPEKDELEITTIGPGAKNGESIVIHVNEEWYIIDSCKIDDTVLPLMYLKTIGVSLDKVTKVFCTHWHRDHINGIDEILRQCNNSEFFVPCVGGDKSNISHILQLAESQAFDSHIWRVYDNCLSVLADRKQLPKLLSHDETLFRNDSIEVHSLGPSDEMRRRFETSLLKLNPDSPSKDDIENIEANLCSAAIAIKYYGLNCLLGGDTETARLDKYNIHLCDKKCCLHDNCGWCDIKNNSTLYPIDTPFSMCKIPHHSSSSAYCPQMWTQDFVKNPLLTTTVFNCPKAEDLPTKEMLSLYHSISDELYITSNGEKAIRPIQRDDIVDLEQNESIQLLEIPIEGIGIIVSRLKAGVNKWITHKFGTAVKVDDIFLHTYHS